MQADAIRVKVGYPVSPDTDDPRSLARYYSNVTVNKQDFFGNVLNASYVVGFYLSTTTTYIFYAGRAKSSRNG